MKTVTIAALCAGLAVAPLAARAADLVLFDQAGRPVAVLVPVAQPMILAPAAMMAPPPFFAQQIGFPVAGLFAQQDALIRRMMGDMHSLPTEMVPAADGANVGLGSTITVSSFSDGHTSCSRTVVYQAQASGAPTVKVSQTGDACSGLPTPSPHATTPIVEPAAPATAAPSGPRLYRIDYRHKATAPRVHRG